MPGRTPVEAAKAFIDPLKLALSCVAHAKITMSPGGRDVVDKPHGWTLNDGDGARLGGGFHLEASMQYRIIHTGLDDPGPFKITTEGYMYALHDAHGDELFGIHWHPNGFSQIGYPHIHLGSPLLGASAPLPAHHHLRTARMTFESTIQWAIEHGAVPLHDDWQNRLTLAEAPHVLYRSWHASPDEADN